MKNERRLFEAKWKSNFVPANIIAENQIPQELYQEAYSNCCHKPGACYDGIHHVLRKEKELGQPAKPMKNLLALYFLEPSKGLGEADYMSPADSHLTSNNDISYPKIDYTMHVEWKPSKGKKWFKWFKPKKIQ